MNQQDRQATKLGPFVATLTPEQPIQHKNLTVVPLSDRQHNELDYVLSADAIESGMLEVTEVGEQGTVPELFAVVQGDMNVLLLSGEELVGAKQNRILNTSILLPAKSKTAIPVSCVEQGRWRHTSRQFRSGSWSSPSMRSLLTGSVSKSYRTRGQARSDQGALWNKVNESIEGSGTVSPTSSMSDIVEQHREMLAGYAGALKCPSTARGVIVAIDGRFVAMDVFDKPSTLAKTWDRLILGYAQDAMLYADNQAEVAADFSVDSASAMLNRMAGREGSEFPSVGMGQDVRFESGDVQGQALVAQGTCVHLCAFPNEELPLT